MKAQPVLPSQPLTFSLPFSMIAYVVEMVAMLPLSKYANGFGAGWRITRARIVCAACLPLCSATCATPGSGLPSFSMCAVSPTTKISG